MTTKTRIMVGTDVMLKAAKNLMDRGEITKEQFAEMERRNERLSSALRENIIVSEQKEG
jgi:hypothetical protein